MDEDGYYGDGYGGGYGGAYGGAYGGGYGEYDGGYDGGDAYGGGAAVVKGCGSSVVPGARDGATSSPSRAMDSASSQVQPTGGGGGIGGAAQKGPKHRSRSRSHSRKGASGGHLHHSKGAAGGRGADDKLPLAPRAPQPPPSAADLAAAAVEMWSGLERGGRSRAVERDVPRRSATGKEPTSELEAAERESASLRVLLRDERKRIQRELRGLRSRL